MQLADSAREFGGLVDEHRRDLGLAFPDRDGEAVVRLEFELGSAGIGAIGDRYVFHATPKAPRPVKFQCFATSGSA